MAEEEEKVLELEDGDDTGAFDIVREEHGLVDLEEKPAVRLVKDMMASLESDEIQDVVAEYVRFLVLRGTAGDPLTAPTIKAAIPRHDKYMRVFLALAQLRLRRLFGFDIATHLIADDKKKKGGPALTRDENKYFLVNVLNYPKLRAVTGYGTLGGEKLGKVIFILSEIVLSSDGELSLDDLETSLGEMDAKLKTTKATKTLLDGLAKEKYLVKKTRQREVDGMNRSYFAYGIGPRSRAEIGTRQVLKFIVDTMGRKDIAADEVSKWMRDEENVEPPPEKKLRAAFEADQ